MAVVLAGLPFVAAASESSGSETCPFAVPATLTVECHRFARPLGGGSAPGLEASLFVMVVRADPATDEAPVVYLDGGPGGLAFLSEEAIGTWWWLIDSYPFLARRDLVVIAQRGSPPSEPSIDCPAFKAATDRVLALGPAARGGPSDGRLRAVVGCVEALRAQGIELDSFTTPHRAADVPAVLRALGYRAWHLWGISYGTHLALSVLRDHPEGTRSLILDSVMTPGVVADLVPEDPSAFRHVLFAACAEDKACAARYPALPATFERVRRRLDDRPLVLMLDTGAVRARIVVFDGTMLEDAIEVTAYYTPLARAVPAILDGADRAKNRSLDVLAGFLASYEREDGMASLALDARWCAEVWPFLDPAIAPVSDVHDVRHENVPDDASYCRSIGVEPLGPEIVAPATSAVPVLLFAGTMDAVTPPAWAHDAARTLANATVIEFPGQAHAFTLDSPCAMGVMAAFLNDPSWADDVHCLASLTPPPFAGAP